MESFIHMIWQTSIGLFALVNLVEGVYCWIKNDLPKSNNRFLAVIMCALLMLANK